MDFYFILDQTENLKYTVEDQKYNSVYEGSLQISSSVPLKPDKQKKINIYLGYIC